ncbi:hypothetical protein SBA2_460034 [Acidobacteriia bacterium SbA2]|nr:hypothetical protein SBA2_460034 [Acidobacteriia bacterium SbA2]
MRPRARGVSTSISLEVAVVTLPGPLRRRPHMIGTQLRSRISIYAGFEWAVLIGKSVTSSPDFAKTADPS